MKVIQCFIASSIIEYDIERIFIGDFIRRYNDDHFDSGVRIKLNLCEDESSNYQPIYDRKISESDIFIALVGNELGPFTRREIFISAGCQRNKKRYILTKNCNLPLDNEILSSFKIITYAHDVLKTVYKLIQEAADEIRDCIEECAQYNVAKGVSSLSVNLPNGEGKVEIAALGNIIRRCRDEEYLISVDEQIKDASDVFLSVVSEGLKQEVERIQQLLDLGLSETLWVFNGNRSLPDAYERKLHSIGNYPEDYTTVKELSQSFHIKLLTALVRHNNENKFKFVVSDHIIYRQMIPSGKRYPVKNLDGNEGEPARRLRRERVIVNILNIYKEKNEPTKLSEALLHLEKENYTYFIYNDSIIGNLPISELATVTTDFLYDQVDLIQRLSNETSYQSLETDIDNLLAKVKNNPNIHYSEQIKITYYLSKIYFDVLNYARAKTILEDIWEQCLLNATVIKQDNLSYIPIDVVNDLCVIYDELGSPAEKTALLDKLFLEFSTGDYKLSSLYVKSVWSRCGKIPRAVLYSVLGAEPEYYNQDNDSLRNYIEALVILIFTDLNKYFAETGRQELANILPGVRDCFDRYLDDGNNVLLNGYIHVLESILEMNIAHCKHGINLIRSCSVQNQYEQELLYCLALLYHQNGLIEEEIPLLVGICENYPENDMNKGVYLHNLAVAYNSIYNMHDAEQTFLKSIEIFSKLKNDDYLAESLEGVSYSYAMMGDFDKALEYATRAGKIGLTDNRCCNYITSLLGAEKYLRAFMFFYLKVQNKEDVTNTLEKSDWPELASLGVNVTGFSVLFNLYHKIVKVVSRY